ncbi:MAG: L-2-amino-thiazoline-4-carboxylic acid hydrolase [Deltaproteobacteria bacterium]|nr:L-2-amino-thiazoline-4-carboxylic acid hydrolase [Deltaproteobacteria bacterium]
MPGPDLRAAVQAAERAGARRALVALRRELGTLQAGAVLGEALLALVRGEPFSHLGPATDPRELGTRRQAGGAVLLYRATRRRVGRERALALTREVLLAGGLVFVERLLAGPALHAADRLPVDERARLMGELGERFPNAEGEVTAATDRSVAFTVTRCRFVELLAAVGEPELAPLFCEVDVVYFQPERTVVRLERSQTRATGGAVCDFVFRW